MTFPFLFSFWRDRLLGLKKTLDWAYKKYYGDPFIQGAAPYLDKAITWARKTGLKVWIDLHGAPLSQNGYGRDIMLFTS